MRLLFLDDDNGRRDQFIQWASGHDLTVVTSALLAVKVLEAEPPFDVVFLDHDLEDMHYTPEGYQESPETTGEAVVDWLEKHQEKHPALAIVHSWNHDGGQRMARRLHEAGIRTIKETFGPKLRDYVRGMGWAPLRERAESKGGE